MNSDLGHVKSILILLPHHDDEFFMGLHLDALSKEFDKLHLLFLTHDGKCAVQRAQESESYLRRSGVFNAQIYDAGSSLGVADGRLFASVSLIGDFIQRFIAESRPEAIVAPAWEGGHHDHDATNYVIYKLWRDSFSDLSLYEYGLYNGVGRQGPWFNMSGFDRDVECGDRSEMGNYIARLVQAFRASVYISQWKSFMGLWPMFFWNRLLGRKIILKKVPNDRDFTCSPHSGDLFYERRFGVSWKEVSRHLNFIGAD
jgi:hypothetical protein